MLTTSCVSAIAADLSSARQSILSLASKNAASFTDVTCQLSERAFSRASTLRGSTETRSRVLLAEARGPGDSSQGQAACPTAVACASSAGCGLRRPVTHSSLPPRKVRHCAIGAPPGQSRWRTSLRHHFFLRRTGDDGADFFGPPLRHQKQGDGARGAAWIFRAHPGLFALSTHKPLTVLRVFGLS